MSSPPAAWKAILTGTLSEISASNISLPTPIRRKQSFKCYRTYWPRSRSPQQAPSRRQGASKLKSISSGHFGRQPFEFFLDHRANAMLHQIHLADVNTEGLCHFFRSPFLFYVKIEDLI